MNTNDKVKFMIEAALRLFENSYFDKIFVEQFEGFRLDTETFLFFYLIISFRY